jgi:hypothetical protein
VQYYDENGNLTETRIGGNRPWRNNNPGNLKGHSNEIGQDRQKVDKGHFSIFPDLETGKQAKAELLKSKYGNHSIKDMIPEYAPSSENDVKTYTKQIQDFSGLDMSKKINDLSKEEFDRLTSAMSSPMTMT